MSFKLLSKLYFQSKTCFPSLSQQYNYGKACFSSRFHRNKSGGTCFSSFTQRSTYDVHINVNLVLFSPLVDSSNCFYFLLSHRLFVVQEISIILCLFHKGCLVGAGEGSNLSLQSGPLQQIPFEFKCICLLWHISS